ncbi:nicotinamide riboside transporter PnuC [Novosphingobium mangrovi (ex Huang et al. 2023)]|uniref:Nicotinamide riboside transporter PnuC n=1 Tax=Novosphingobium mangrovi (ex Huang et al. 2023) TaxID=2976432 RepID=A0ABT2I8N3_9SPHN|nr:nicotinamide riboside transporter PnuC [Novosphingobium mangrovi (ex Huang et al. 2023)]MCT2401134.1 nicotinamide riboside transporter PnuC [Novosphingobium mangrovi (ex Huang et al. 2023)]
MTPEVLTTLEWVAAGFGVVNIALLIWRSIWNFPFGIMMVALYIFVFWEKRLYGEAMLQVFFILAQAWGWWLWYKTGGEDPDHPDRVPVRWLDNMSRAVWLLATAAISLNLGWVMHRFTDAAMPYADAAITGASVSAQILLAFRRIENWVLWIVIDVAAIGLYINRGLHPTAGLYGGMLVMSLLGLKEWVHSAKSGPKGTVQIA